MDIDAFQKVHTGKMPDNYIKAFYYEFVSYSEFRSLFYKRVGRWIKLIGWIYPQQTHFALDVPVSQLAGGIFVQHGYCTDLSAESIGEGLWLYCNTCSHHILIQRRRMAIFHQNGFYQGIHLASCSPQR